MAGSHAASNHWGYPAAVLRLPAHSPMRLLLTPTSMPREAAALLPEMLFVPGDQDANLLYQENPVSLEEVPPPQLSHTGHPEATASEWLVFEG